MKVKHGYLADYFDGFGYKTLKPVEIDPVVSHEHEFNGISGFKLLFGTERQSIGCRVIYLTDEIDNSLEDVVTLTWYDARINHPSRSEFRLYYSSSECFLRSKPDDLMILCKNKDDSDIPFTMLISRDGDTVTNQLLWLFGISPERLSTAGYAEMIDSFKDLNFFSSHILNKIGIELKKPDDSMLGRILENYADKFPTTVEFSKFSRSFVTDIKPEDNPDNALVKYLEHEEYLFRVFEEHLVNKKLQKGFSDVEDFIGFSLSVHNRRKSRAGYAMENHLRHIFDSCGIQYSFNEITENKSKPDFIFPSIEKYRNSIFEPAHLTMLGVKTTCKDRWRQILTEAERVTGKHLCTLEPSISENQTNEMKSQNLQLVVPASIIPTYKPGQQSWLMTISNFVGFVAEKQNKS